MLTLTDKILIQTFYNKFVWLIDVKVLRTKIVRHLIGKDNYGEYTLNFFTQPLFNELFNPKTAFFPILYRDNFVIIDRVEHNLEKMREANKPAFFSWPFLEEFDIDFKFLGFDRPKEEKAKDTN